MQWCRRICYLGPSLLAILMNVISNTCFVFHSVLTTAFEFYLWLCNLAFCLIKVNPQFLTSKSFIWNPCGKYKVIFFVSNRIHILVIVIFNAWSLYSIHRQINNSKCTLARLLPFDNVFQKQVDVKVNITCRLYQMVSISNCLGFVEWNS